MQTICSTCMNIIIIFVNFLFKIMSITGRPQCIYQAFDPAHCIIQVPGANHQKQQAIGKCCITLSCYARLMQL